MRTPGWIRAIREIVVLLGLGLASATLMSCGSDEGQTSFEGTYEVISHTRNTDGCNAEGEAFDGDSYFRLARVDGGNRLAYYPCDGPDNCDDIANSTKSFSTRNEDEWRNMLWAGNDSGSMCILQLTERILTSDSNGIRIERRVFSKTYEDSEVECEGEAAESRRDELECQVYEKLIAVPAGTDAS